MTLNYDVYKKTLPFPNKADYTHYNHYSGGQFLGKTTTRKGNPDFPKGTVVEEVVDEAYQEARIACALEASTLINKFREDILALLEIENHPKAEKLFDMAWEDSHSEGLQAVAFRCEELAELLS